MISLHDFLDEQEQVNEKFVVDSEDKANWVLRKIRAIEEKKSSNLALAEAETAKIEAWLEMVNGQLDRDLEYFRGLIATFATELRAGDPKFKLLRLPNGKIRYQKQQPKWNYEENKLVESLKKAGRDDLVRVKTIEEPEKNAIKKDEGFKVENGKLVVVETGEVIEGVTIEHREDELKIEVMEL